jgi:hypothetical protein
MGLFAQRPNPLLDSKKRPPEPEEQNCSTLSPVSKDEFRPETASTEKQKNRTRKQEPVPLLKCTVLRLSSAFFLGARGGFIALLIFVAGLRIFVFAAGARSIFVTSTFLAALTFAGESRRRTEYE